MELIRIEDLFKTYYLGEVDVPVLKGVSLSIKQGEMVALIGASGSGKSTLMNILGLLDRPTTGHYWLNGQEVSQLSADKRRRSATATSALYSRPSICSPAPAHSTTCGCL